MYSISYTKIFLRVFKRTSGVKRWEWDSTSKHYFEIV